jgi:predicted RNA binding protein YcfA (HicA-like mRNA interferase family)
MSKLPRDMSGLELVRLLAKVDYKFVKQKGSHIRLERISNEGNHAITIPAHDSLKVGTFHAILKDIADHLKITKSDLINKLF